MPNKSRYVAARTLVREGWTAEAAMVEAADGSKRQGWKWTDPTGSVCYSFGKHAEEPTRPKRAKGGATWHMKFRKLSPRNVVFLEKTLPVPCPACKEPFPERSLVPYGGGRCCAGCLVRRKATAEREEYRKATFAGRARSYMESRAGLGFRNAPEVCP